MATAFSHAVLAASLVHATKPGKMIPGLYIAGAALAMAPDLDVAGLYMGIDYASLWGHRGMTHSLVFAALCALPIGAWLVRKSFDWISFARVWLTLALCMASHGLLDAMTNGGLGIALLSPWDQTRYFFEYQPIQVSPLGLSNWSYAAIMAVAKSEFLWVWLPAFALLAISVLLRRFNQGKPV